MYIVSDRRRNLKYIIKSVLPFNKDGNESRTLTNLPPSNSGCNRNFRNVGFQEELKTSVSCQLVTSSYNS